MFKNKNGANLLGLIKVNSLIKTNNYLISFQIQRSFITSQKKKVHS